MRIIINWNVCFDQTKYGDGNNSIYIPIIIFISLMTFILILSKFNYLPLYLFRYISVLNFIFLSYSIWKLVSSVFGNYSKMFLWMYHIFINHLLMFFIVDNRSLAIKVNSIFKSLSLTVLNYLSSNYMDYIHPATWKILSESYSRNKWHNDVELNQVSYTERRLFRPFGEYKGSFLKNIEILL